jgi:hypothetical protein
LPSTSLARSEAEERQRMSNEVNASTITTPVSSDHVRSVPLGIGTAPSDDGARGADGKPGDFRVWFTIRF